MCRFEIYQLLGREHLAKVSAPQCPLSAPHRYQYCHFTRNICFTFYP